MNSSGVAAAIVHHSVLCPAPSITNMALTAKVVTYAAIFVPISRTASVLFLLSSITFSRLAARRPSSACRSRRTLFIT